MVAEELDRSGKTEGQCRWFLKCQNQAFTTLRHPILGNVPICDKCMHRTMLLTDFASFEGEYDVIHMMYRLAYDHNSGADSELQLYEPEQGADVWNIPVPELLCVEGLWNDVGFGINGDPTLPDWKELGIDPTQIGDKTGVYYVGNHLVIMGDNGLCACYWIFKKA